MTIVEEQPEAPRPRAGADTEPAGQVVPYEFLTSQVAFAIEAVEGAMRGGADSWTAAKAVTEAEAPAELGDTTALRRELCRALAYSLELARAERDPGCEMNADGNDLLSAVRDVPEPVIRLWQAVADGVSEPAAIARFADLLWCRRVHGAGAYAARAADAYLQLPGSGDIDMDAIDYLLRAWTLARQTINAGLDQQVRGRLERVADDVITEHFDTRPGILLPALGALARGPLRVRKAPPAVDPIDVDDLLLRAADSCGRGMDATEIARYRRSRTRDPDALQAIAREEAAAYFRDAEAARHPAVRMARLTQAAQIARVRGLGDLERRAAVAMQNIDPATLGMRTFSASTTVPAYEIEPLLNGFTRPARWQDALDVFLLLPWCPTGEITDLRAKATATRSPLSQILRPVLFSGGLPRASADTDADLEKHEMSFFAQIVAENHGRILAAGLTRFAQRYGIPSEDDLVDYMLTRGARDPALARSLSKALRHFWHDDVESCIHLATPKIETAARALLLELDEGIYRAEVANAAGGYPGLYVLLDKLEEIALDESWAYFFTWLLTGPWGANLRNDVSHGLPAPMTPTYAALILRALTVLAVVAGPAPIAQVRSGGRRARDELVAVLGHPTGDASMVGTWFGKAAAATERLAWRLHLARLRRVLHRRPPATAEQPAGPDAGPLDTPGPSSDGR